MSKIDVREILSKGVPCNLPVWIVISFHDIKELCKNTKDIDEQLNQARDKYQKLADNTYNFDVKKYIRYDVNAAININPKTLTRNLVVCLVNIEESLLYYLGLNPNEPSVVKVVKQKIDILKSIATEEELMEIFPKIYDKYCQDKKLNDFQYKLKQAYMTLSSKERLNKVKETLKFTGINCDPFEFLRQIENSQEKFNFPKYLMNIKYECEKVFEESQKTISAPIFPLNIDEKDKETFEMYVAASFLETAKHVGLAEQQSYMYYLSSFFMDNKDKVDKDKKFSFYGYERDLSYNDLYEEYKDILVHNPNLQIIDLKKEDFNGMTLDEVNEFMDEYIRDLTASWEFFKDDRVDTEILNKINEHYQGLLKTEEGKQKFNDIIEKYIEKKEFFDNTDPYYRIFGKGTFEGYVGYLYKNGKVVFEKFFDNIKTGRLAKEQAIYIMNIDEFCKLTNLSKTEIRKDKLCSFVHHQGDWKGRVKKHIEEETDISPVLEIEKLKKQKILTY